MVYTETTVLIVEGREAEKSLRKNGNGWEADLVRNLIAALLRKDK